MMLALVGVIALWFWLRQPPSAESLKGQISTFLKENDWSAAQGKLELLNKYHADSVPLDERDELQASINSIKSYTQSKVISGPYTFVPPSSEAERFYRRGVLAYYSGQVEEARTTWKNLVATFKDVPSYSAWVRLAEEALKPAKARPSISIPYSKPSAIWIPRLKLA